MNELTYWQDFYAGADARFIDYYLEFAQEHDQTTPVHFVQLDPERENLLLALEQAFHHEKVEAVLAIVRAVALPANGYLGVRGFWKESLACLKLTIQISYQHREHRNAGLFAVEAGWLFQQMGDYDNAKQIYEEALEAFKRYEDIHVSPWNKIVAGIHERLGVLAQTQRDYKSAEQHFRQSWELKSTIQDDPKTIAAIWHQWGGLMLAQAGQSLKFDFNSREDPTDKMNRLNQRARGFYEDSLRLIETVHEPLSRAHTLKQLGEVAKNENQWTQAGDYFQASFEIYEAFGDRSGIAGIHHSLGNLWYKKQAWDQAISSYLQSLEIKQDLGDRAGIIISLGQLAHAYYFAGKYAQAREANQQRYELQQIMGDSEGIAETLLSLSQVAEKEGDVETACFQCRQSLQMFRDQNNAHYISLALGHYAHLAKQSSNFQEAEQIYQEVVQLCWQLNDKEGAAEEMINLANLYEQQGRLKEAEAILENVQRIGVAIRSISIINVATESLVRIQIPEPKGFLGWLKFLRIMLFTRN